MMKKFVFLVAALLAAMFAGQAYAGCHAGQALNLSNGYNYSYNANALVLPANAIQFDIVQPANNAIRVDPQAVVEVQKIERTVLPQQVLYTGVPQAVQQVRQVQVQSNYGLSANPLLLVDPRVTGYGNYGVNSQLLLQQQALHNQQLLLLNQRRNVNVQRNVIRNNAAVIRRPQVQRTRTIQRTRTSVR